MNPDPIIRAVQTFVGVEPDGVPRPNHLESHLRQANGQGVGRPPTRYVDPIVRAVQTSVGVEPDGSPRPNHLESHLRQANGQDLGRRGTSSSTSTIRTGLKAFPRRAISMILEAEGIDQPAKWPGGESGITLRYGCDIGADPKSLEYWRGILTDDQINRLAVAKGKIGHAAAAIARQFSDIKVSKADALRVFMKHDSAARDCTHP